MNTQWMIDTNGDPAGAVQGFLRAIWRQAELDGLLVAASGNQPAPNPVRLLKDPEQMKGINPFDLLMTENLARRLPSALLEHPAKRLGVLLRPCELRALVEMVKRIPIKIEIPLTICIDCLGTLPPEDYEWRVGRKEPADLLSEQALQFARQGGILDYRRRMACQMCAAPGAQGADLNIHVLGLPARQYILVQASDARIAEHLHLDQIAKGKASSDVVQMHERALAQLAKRRQRTLERLVENLAGDQPRDLEALIAQLEQCGECQDCMVACPICAVEFPERGTDGHYSPQAMMRWLVSCAGCGMCEQACAAQRPLTAIFSHIREKLDEEFRYTPGVSWDTPLPF